MVLKRPRLSLLLALLFAAFFSTGGLLLPSQGHVAHAATSTSLLSLSSTKVYPGQQLTATGQGLAPQMAFELYLGDGSSSIYLATVYTDSNASYSTTFTFPQNQVPQGQYAVNLNFNGETSGTPLAQVTISVEPMVFDAVGNPGFPLSMTGAGFNPNETVSVALGDTEKGTDEGTATTDASGNLSFSFTLPSGLQPGRYPVSVARSGQKPAVVTGKIRIYPLAVSVPGGVKSGQPLSVRVTGFLPYETLTGSWNANGGQDLSYEIYGVRTDGNGAAQFLVHLPPTTPGSYIITIKGITSGLSASGTFKFGPGISLYADGRKPGQANPGGQITVYGGGFNANELVSVYFQTEKNGVTTATTDANGSFTATITVPMQYSSTTTYYVYAENAAGTLHTNAQFTYVTPTLGYFSRGGGGAVGTVFIDGFGANETIQIVDRYQQSNQVNATTLTADATGAVVAVVYWPSSAHNSADQMTFAAIGQSTQIALTATHPLDPAILSNNSYRFSAVGQAGDTLQLQAIDFVAGEQVQITFNDKVVYTGTSDANGAVAASIVIPALEDVSSGAGNIQVKAVGLSSNLVAGLGSWLAFTFYYQPTFMITPTAGPSGTTITVTGAHFPAGVAVPIGWDGPFTPDPSYYGYPAGTYTVADTDQNGNLTATIQANNLVGGQTYHVTASDFTYGLSLVSTVAFVAQ